MGRLTGRLVVGERVIYRRIVAVFDDPAPGRPRTGYFEVLEGMVPFLSTVRPYRLALDDGRSEEVYITGTWPGATADVTAFAFRLSTRGGV
jgi:hypothetical protein